MAVATSRLVRVDVRSRRFRRTFRRDGPCPRGHIGVGPRNVALDGEVDLERRGSLAVTPIGPLDPPGHDVAVDRQRRRGAEVEHDEVGIRDVAAAGDAHAGRDGAAVRAERGGQGLGDRSGSAFGDRPTVAVSAGQEHQAKRCGERPIQPGEHVRGRAAEQRACLLGAKPAGHHGGRQQGARPERSEADRVARNIDHRAEQIVGQLVESGHQITDGQPPPGLVGPHAGGGLVDRPIQHAGGPVVEWVSAVDLRPLPPQPVALQVDLFPERRTDAQRMRRRTVVVDESGHRQLTRARSPADRVARLQHLHVDTVPGEVDRRGQAVGPGADDDRFRHGFRGVARWRGDRKRGGAGRSGSTPSSVTWTGNSSPGAGHGWRLSMSSTLT